MIEDIRVVRIWEWEDRGGGYRQQRETGYEIQVKVAGEWQKVREEWRKSRGRCDGYVETDVDSEKTA